MKKRHTQKLHIISVILLFCLSMPIMAVYNKAEVQVFGIPVFYLVIFIIWGIAVFTTWYIINKYDI